MSAPAPPSPMDRVLDAVGTRVVGKTEALRTLAAGLLADGHVLLEDLPGLGKTLVAKCFASALGLTFQRVQFTADLMPTDITGGEVYDPGTGKFSFRRGPVFTQVLLADEINRAPPKVQSALLEAMQEHTVTAGGQTHPLPEPFFVLATQNPLEMEGTYPLPEAQLDRFLFKVLVPFPPDDDLALIAERTTGLAQTAPPEVLQPEELARAMELARLIVVAPHVMRYAVRLAAATHPDRSPVPEVQRFVRYGSSPRGLQALVLAAKVAALRASRWNVAFADLEQMAAPALRHRMILQFEALAEGVTADALISRILATVSHES